MHRGFGSLCHGNASLRRQLPRPDEVTRSCRSSHDLALTDLEREFQLARSKPRHLAPQPKPASSQLRPGLNGLIDSLITSQHALEIFRRSLPNREKRAPLDRLANRLTKILAEIRKLKST